MLDAKKDILDNWSDTEQEDALTATYDMEFASVMIEAKSHPVAKVLIYEEYRNAIEEINLEGGFVN